MTGKKYILILGIGTLLVWLSMAAAGSANYDANYAVAAVALLASLSITAFVGRIWRREREIYREHRLAAHLFLLTSSPVSLYLFVVLYSEYIGPYFKN